MTAVCHSEGKVPGLAIDIRGWDLQAAVKRDVVKAKVIGNNEDNVRLHTFAIGAEIACGERGSGRGTHPYRYSYSKCTKNKYSSSHAHSKAHRGDNRGDAGPARTTHDA